MRDLDSYGGSFVVGCALKLTPLPFVRLGELRRAECDEIDLEAAEWRIPAEKMKMRREHVVPLSTQAAAILCEPYPLTGHAADLRPDAPRFVFPSSRSRLTPMSENTINAALSASVGGGANAAFSGTNAGTTAAELGADRSLRLQ